MAFSALKRKCGLICARSAFSSDLLDLQPQLLRDQVLLLTPALQADVLEHEPEDAAERAQHREIFGEHGAHAGFAEHADAQLLAGHRTRQDDLMLGRRFDRPAADAHDNLRAEDLAEPGLGGGNQCLFVRGRLHRGEDVLDRLHRREFAAKPDAIQPAFGSRHQPGHHHRHRREGDGEHPGRAGPSGSCCSHGRVSARNTPSTITLNRISSARFTTRS